MQRVSKSATDNEFKNAFNFLLSLNVLSINKYYGSYIKAKDDNQEE